MKDKYINFTICSLTIIFFIECILHTEIIINTFTDTLKSFIFNLMPTMLPFFIISDLLTNYGFPRLISQKIGKFMHIFKLSNICAYPLIMSTTSGFPANAKVINDMLDKRQINEIEANKLLTFTHFSNPLFIIGTVGVIFLQNKAMAIIILIFHYLTNLIIGLIFNKIFNYTSNNNKEIPIVQEGFVKTLSNAIVKGINSLFIVFGIILFSSLITNLLSSKLNINPFNKALITSFLEITKGLREISCLSLSINIKATLMTFFISFGGLSIHMQIISILSKYKINYLTYFLARIGHAAISSILIYLFLTFIY